LAQPEAPPAPARPAFDRELADAPWERGRGASAPPPEVVVAPEPPIERPSVEPQRARRKKKGGGGGLFLLILLLGGAGAAYYYRADLLALAGGVPAAVEDVDWPYSGAEEEAPVEAPAPATPEPEASSGDVPPEGQPVDLSAPSEPAVTLEQAAAAPRSAAPAPVSAPAATRERTAQDADAGPPPLDFLFRQPPPAPPPPAPEREQPVFSYGRPVEQEQQPEPSSAAGAPPPAPANLVWARQPDGAAVADAYPEMARRRGVGGRAVLRCLVQASGALDCRPTAEQPPRMGFADAALRVAGRYRASAKLSDGSSAIGRETELTIVFKPE